MSKILFHAELMDRDFGRMAVSTAALMKWADDCGAVVPPTLPDIRDFDAVAIESLLVAFERAVPTMTAETLLAVAATIPSDPKLRRLIDRGVVTSARWHVGADIHQQWRRMLDAAVRAGELATVDALTGLPMFAPNSAAPTVAPATKQGIGPAITTDQLCEAFDGLKWSYLGWRNTINKRVPAWLDRCQATPGTPGASAKQATWFPINVALALVAGEPRGAAVTVQQVDHAFKTQPKLRQCARAWAEYREDHPVLG